MNLSLFKNIQLDWMAYVMTSKEEAFLLYNNIREKNKTK